jgi:hypothetical protein
MSEICTEVLVVTTTGTAGSASGSATSGILRGLLLDIYLDYHASCPATADVTVAYSPTGGNILAVANNATDGSYAPRQAEVTAANVATGGYTYFPLAGKVSVSVAQADALTACVTAHVRYMTP